MKIIQSRILTGMPILRNYWDKSYSNRRVLYFLCYIIQFYSGDVKDKPKSTIPTKRQKISPKSKLPKPENPAQLPYTSPLPSHKTGSNFYLLPPPEL